MLPRRLLQLGPGGAAARVGLLALLFGLCLPALAGPAAPPRFTWPNPDMVEEIDLGMARAQGIPMRMRVIKVRHGADEMLKLYLRAFARSGLYVPPFRDQLQLARELTVVALDPERLLSYTVIFHPNRDGTTSLLLGEANLALRQAQGDDLAPIFPGGRDVLRSEQEGARVVVYSVKALPAEVESFYREVLGKAGYGERDAKLEPGVFSRGSEQLQLVLRPRQDGQLSVGLLYRANSSEGSPSAVRPFIP